MPKEKTIRNWSHARVRKVMAKRAKGALSSLLQELRNDASARDKSALLAGEIDETEFLERLSKKIAADLAGPGFQQAKEMSSRGDFKEHSTDDIISQARSIKK